MPEVSRHLRGGRTASLRPRSGSSTEDDFEMALLVVQISSYNALGYARTGISKLESHNLCRVVVRMLTSTLKE